MDALELGPFVLSSERAIAFLGLAVFTLVADIWARRPGNTALRASLSSWASHNIWIVLLGARLGFVIRHYQVYLGHPLSALYIWQGGFTPFWGIGLALLYSFYTVRKTTLTARTMLPPALAGLVVWAAVSVYGTAMPASQRATLTLPELTLESLYTADVSVASFAGQAVVINIWATWCAPCARELPMFTEVASNSDVPLLFVNQLESREKVQGYLQDRGLAPNYVLLDKRGEVAERLRVKGLPSTFFFNADGSLYKRHVGELSRAALLAYLNDLQQNEVALP